MRRWFSVVLAVGLDASPVVLQVSGVAPATIGAVE
jgi:hypothetical protein